MLLARLVILKQFSYSITTHRNDFSAVGNVALQQCNEPFSRPVRLRFRKLLLLLGILSLFNVRIVSERL